MLPDLQKIRHSSPDPVHVALAIILLAAAALRFFHYSSFSLSNDELSAINRLRFNTFGELVRKGFYVDGHPGGIQVFLWYWSRFFGISAEVLRLPFVVFGILSVFFSYLVAGRMFGKVSGIFTAASLTFLQFPLLYSQIARPYGSGLFFSLAMVYCWLIILFGKGGSDTTDKVPWYYWAGYVLFTVLCMYNHYFSFLLALIAGITGLFYAHRKLLGPYILCGLISSLLFLPHIPITLNHLSYRGVGLWLGKPSWDWPLEHIGFLLNDSLIMLFLFVGSSALLTMFSGRQKTDGRMLITALLFFLVPMLAGFIYSLVVNPVLQHPVLIFSFPFLIMLLFINGGDVFNRWRQILLAAFFVSGMTETLLIGNYYNTQHFGEFRGVAETALRWEKEVGESNLHKVVVTNSPFYLDYYFKELGDSTRFDMYEISDEKDLAAFDQLLVNDDNPFFLYAYTKPERYKVSDMIRSVYPYVEKSIHFGTLSAITLYSRTGRERFEKGYEMQDLKVLRQDFEEDTAGMPVNEGTGKEYRQYAGVVGEGEEFGPSLKMSLDSFSGAEALRMEATIEIQSGNLPTGALLVVSVDRGEQSLSWAGTPVDWRLKTGKWDRILVSTDMKGADCRGAELKTYIWNKEGKSFMIDNFELRLIKYGNHSPFSEEQIRWGDF